MKDFLKKIGFIAKDNADGIFYKNYSIANNYIIEVDFKKEQINYGNKIKSDSKTTQNFSQEENRVVLECVNRLLEKGYNPADIILEKVFPTGHGTSGRLDILVKKDGKSFLMIECKTRGGEFEKEYKKMQKDGGQLFTYFQQDRDTEYLMLYTSNESLEYKNEIIKIEESYKETSNVADLYTRWNKFTKQNGIFEDWVKNYDFESKALTLNDLRDIKETDASFIFNRFLEILRHNTVSDKGNAFNKIFTLFLCKIHDEGTKREDEELEFQWKEGIDNNITFQTRLTDLYKRGMMEFLSKEITDFSDKQINDEFGYLGEDVRAKILEKFTKIRLQKNNEFAIKEVFDDETFEDNAIVLKEVVELLQNYKVRYTKKQPFLGDFFELLLTTGLKQEAGQFFTPVPIARFICKSIPIKKVIEDKIIKGDSSDLLPTTIDYAAGSGHFLTEAMEEIQKIINKKDVSNQGFKIKDIFKRYIEHPYDWAGNNVYGIEKDYRLVRTSKVGCYLNGDGIATVIHGDGLDSFKNSEVYKGDLKEYDKADEQYNGRFDLVLSNPPYSVSAFKGNLKKEDAEKDFNLYNFLTDNSSEIEALFIERTSQLLKEGGIAGIILPSSILSNTGIYGRAREIILKDFNIVAITELGSGTFMATGTNTVVLFLRKRNKFFAKNLKSSTDKFFVNLQDITLNGVEKSISKYVNEIWEGIKLEDYISMIKKTPNENIKNHEIFKEYTNKIKLTRKSEEDRQKEFFDKVIELEKEKLFYFVLTYPQNLVLIKSGEKNIEKEFLGYEFSNRKGSEGIHPIQRGKLIDECTKLFDPEIIDNPNKASTYIYDNFQNNFDREISEELKDHVFKTSLVDLLTFDRVDFEKTISLNSKKKVRIESKWEIKKLGEIIEILDEKRIPISQRDRKKGNYPYYGATGIIDYIDDFIFDEKLVLIGEDGAKWGKNEKSSFIVEGKYWVNNHAHVLKPNRKILNDKYLVEILNNFDLSDYITGLNVPKLNQGNLKEIQIPLPPLDIQQKIVDEIGELENIEEKNLNKIGELDLKIKSIILNSGGENKKFSEVLDLISGQSPESKFYNNIGEGLPFYQGKKDYGDDYLKNPNTWTTQITKISIKNDVLMSVRAPVGDVNLNNFEKICIGRGLSALRPLGELNYRFLYYYLKFNQDIIIGKKGVGFDSISREDILNLKIPLPTLETQKQIVAQIEKIEQELEKLKAELEEIPNKKKEILKKYL